MQLRRIIVFTIALLMLAGSFFLPNAVAGISDINRLNNLTTIDSQSISFNAAPVLSIPERIELISNSKTEIMALNSGNMMTDAAAGSRAIRELTRFIGGGPFAFDFDTCAVEQSAAAFAIDTGNPTVNMIIWELTLMDVNENSAMVTLDDETGIIMKIIYRQGGRSQNPANFYISTPAGQMETELYDNALKMTEMMADYYGLQIILGDHDFNGTLTYYRGDLTDGARIIPMFGVIRPTGFTMNERV